MKSKKPRIYLDHNASTPVDPRVLSAITHQLEEIHGNPSSPHQEGQEARRVVTRARDTISNYLGVRPDEIIFTANGTEALNMLIRGVIHQEGVGHIITSNLEHSAVYKCVQKLEERGCEATYLSCGTMGSISTNQVREAIRSNTRLISIMAVNNETGVKNDLVKIGNLAKEHGIPLIVDGVAWLGKEEVRIPEGVSAICFSGQKFHAPKGIGFAYVKRGLKFEPLVLGGNHEFGRRAGTENLTGIVAIAKAVELLKVELPEATERMRELRDRLENELQKQLGCVKVNGEGERTVNTSNLCFEGVDGESLLMRLDMEGIAVSHGSACASGGLEPSRVLLNMGFSMDRVRSSLRFSVSRMTTMEEIERCIETVVRLVKGDKGVKG